MGILRTREEYLPVTCAIMKAEDREAFFSSLKKQNARPDQIARLCEVSVETANEWISGKTNIPYHSLQTLAHHYSAALPPIGELRREYLAVSQQPSRREAPRSAPEKPAREAKAPKTPGEPRARRGRGGKRGEEPRKQAKRDAEAPQQAAEGSEPSVVHPSQPRQRQQPRQQQQKRQQQSSQPQQSKGGGRPQRAPAPKGPRVPEPSEQLAYWVGVTILSFRREGTELVMIADRRMGQNFAGTWANLTRDLLGVKPTVKMVDDGKAQEARMPIAGFEDFLDRLEIKDGRAPGEPGVPRWAWSNPAWKAACLKGIVDARAFFQRAPALVLEGIPERLGKAIQKMLSAFKVEATIEGTTITLKGAEAVDLYFEKVGASNMKLRDQYRAYKYPRGSRPPADDKSERVPGDVTPASEEAGEEEHGRVIAEEVEAADEEAEMSNEALQGGSAPEAAAEEPIDEEAAMDAAAARKAHASQQPSRIAPPPEPPKQAPQKRRRTLYRGRPDRR